MVRNRIGWRERLARLRGSTVTFDLRDYDQPLDDITRLEAEVRAVSDADLRARARQLRDRVSAGTPRDSVLTAMLALVRDASRRAVGLRPFDEQVIAAVALARGHVIEMQTGEGKTLAAVMPAALFALEGRGVHVLTFNDYLARRDAEWMGPIFRMLGLDVGFVQHAMTTAERRRSYASDVTYVTAKEAGFDYLRDQQAMNLAEVVHRPFHAAIVDEADSIMIDEARVPLVIAGEVRRETSALGPLARLVASFTPGLEFDSDEYGRNVELTEAGIERAERAIGCGSLHDEANYRLLTELNCALHAQVLLRRDVDYIVRDGRVEIVDELTGRVVRDRHWPDGLQAALEAKEGLARRSDGEILGSITLQHFLELYPHLCGMTGTARSAAAELHAMYGLGVTIVPTHRPMIRVDRPDVVFSHREAKHQALVDEIAKTRAAGRPVLVGTLTVGESEELARRLLAANVPCQVLNAKNDEAEAAVVAQAGVPGAVTISTNMAGRGTDIKLGGEHELDRDQVVALGGLYVIGTNRHESLRVDLQLRGRAGRQGDPGESRFFVSLDDDLLVRYGLRQLVPERLIGTRTDAPQDHPILRREIARAQRIIEGQNFEIRKTLTRYADVVEHQRRILLDRRDKVLAGHDDLQVWSRRPDLRAALVAAAGEAAVQRAEQAVTLFHIDRAWRDHLALIADLREGIHLVTLAGKDPLTHFTTTVIGAFDRIDAAIDEAVVDALARITARDGRLDLDTAGIRGPSSTWTYLVNDDPFQNQIGRMLSGPGRTTIAMYSGLFLWPLLLLWAAADRFRRRRRR